MGQLSTLCHFALLSFMRNIAKQPPFGIAGLACLACLVIIHCATGPLLSHLLVWWCRLLIYLAAPIATAFTILYHSSWHREFSRAKRAVVIGISSCIVVVVTLLVAGLALFVVLLFVSGPPSAGYIPNAFGFDRFPF